MVAPINPARPGPALEDAREGPARRCPECGAPDPTVDQRGERVCPRCGLVLDAAPLDDGPERRAFTPRERRERARAGGRVDLLAPHDGLGVGVPRGSGAGSLRRTERRVGGLDGSERRFQRARRVVRSVGGELGCPRDVQRQAETLLQSARKRDLTQGRSYRALAGAALLATCRVQGLGRSEDELLEALDEDRSRLRSSYRTLVRELDLPTPPIRPRGAIHRLLSRLEVPEEQAVEVARRAIELLSQVEEHCRGSGKHPMGWAAGAVYLAARDLPVQLGYRPVSEAAGVSVPTVRARVDEIQELGVPDAPA